MSIDSIGNFFVDIKEDISAVINDKDKSKEIENQRISSLCFRIFGLIGIVFGGIASLTIAASFVLAPLMNTILLIVSVAAILISYDHIVIGCNKRKLIKDCDKLCSGNICNMFSGGVSLGKKVYKETVSGVPADYEGTIIYKPVYRMFNSHSTAQTA